MATKQGQTLEETLAARAKAIPAGRLGDPYEFGQACAYLCSTQASYVTGQNFLIDGGTYPGTF
jgi:3-oxoacyl-[acyl-carrier protein] reductase